MARERLAGVRPAAGLALLLLMAPTVAAGEPLRARVAAPGLFLDGLLEVGGPDAMVEVQAPAHGEVLAVEGLLGEARLIHSARDAVDVPAAGDVWLQPTTWTETLPLAGATVRVHSARADFGALLAPLDDGGLVLRAEGPHQLGLRTVAHGFAIGSSEGEQPYYYHRDVPAPHLQGVASGGRWRGADLAGAELAVTGATLEVEGPEGRRTFELGERADTRLDAGGQRMTYRHTSLFAVLTVRQGTLTPAPGAEATFRATEVVVGLDGRVLAPRAEGDVRAGGHGARADGAALDATGALRVRGRADQEGLGMPEATWQFEGDAARVAVGRVVLVEPSAVPAMASAAAGLAVLLAGLAGAPKLLALATAAWRPAEALTHPRRRRIYDTVLQHPGVTLREVQRLTGLRWAALQYHAGVLLSAGALRSARRGRRASLACDVHRFDDRQLAALGLLRSARVRATAEALVRARAPLSQADLAVLTGLPPRMVSRHLQALGRLGLATPTLGRPRLHAPSPDLPLLLAASGTSRRAAVPENPQHPLVPSPQ